MKIGEVAERTNTPASTIRYYEQIGLLSKPQRVSGQRVYERDVLGDLEAIAAAKSLDFTLEEIKLLLGTLRDGREPSEQCRSMAQQKLHELEELLVKIERMKTILEDGLSCTCTSLSGCYLSEGDGEAVSPQ